MRITIKLFANHRTGRFKEAQWEFPAPTPVSQVVTDLGIRDRELGMVLVNGSNSPLDRPLGDGDVLSLFPLIGGG